MIKIERTECPDILRDNQNQVDRYNRKEVVTALWEMQCGKCCYCERFLPEEGHAKAVEHFRPKAYYPSRRNEWDNLLLACAQCNGVKSDRFPVFSAPDTVTYVTSADPRKPAMIDPTKLDPEAHLNYSFDGRDFSAKVNALVFANTSLGRETIEVVDLASPYNHKERLRHFRLVLCVHLRNLLEAKVSGNESSLARAKEEFSLLMIESNPLTALTRAFARFNKLDQAPFFLKIPGPVDPPQGA